MTYRLTLKSNPRMIVLLLLTLALLGVGVGSFFIIGAWGILVIIILGFISYHLFKFIGSHLNSRIVTHDDGLTFYLPLDDTQRYSWDEITHAGFCRSKGKEKPFIFIYASEDDRLISIPTNYDDIDKLKDELEERTSVYADYELEDGESIQDRLKSILGIPEAGDIEEEPKSQTE